MPGCPALEGDSPGAGVQPQQQQRSAQPVSVGGLLERTGLHEVFDASGGVGWRDAAIGLRVCGDPVPGQLVIEFELRCETRGEPKKVFSRARGFQG